MESYGDIILGDLKILGLGGPRQLNNTPTPSKTIPKIIEETITHTVNLRISSGNGSGFHKGQTKISLLSKSPNREYTVNYNTLFFFGSKIFFFQIWELGTSRQLKNTPTECRNISPTRQAPPQDFQKIIIFYIFHENPTLGKCIYTLYTVYIH